jgi:hypothetical protein
VAVSNRTVHASCFPADWLTDSPRLFFAHVWAMGDPSNLAHQMRATLDATDQ